MRTNQILTAVFATAIGMAAFALMFRSPAGIAEPVYAAASCDPKLSVKAYVTACDWKDALERRIVGTKRVVESTHKTHGISGEIEIWTVGSMRPSQIQPFENLAPGKIMSLTPCVAYDARRPPVTFRVKSARWEGGTPCRTR